MRVNDSLKVHQQDAGLLDTEFSNILTSTAANIVKWITQESSWHRQVLTIAIKFVLWKLSIWDRETTYGGMLQGVKFVQENGDPVSKWKRLAFLCEMLLPDLPDLTERLPQSLLRSLNLARTGFPLFTAINFLATGRYHTPLSLLLRLRLVYTARQFSRDVSLEFLNRQLVWHAFTEFLMSVLPLIKLPRIKHRLQRLFAVSVNQGELSLLPKRICAICYKSEAENVDGSAEVVNPVWGDCNCIYCYVCLESRVQSNGGEGWNCLRCGFLIKYVRPFCRVEGKK